MIDRNICPNCDGTEPLTSSACSSCGTTLVVPTLGSLAFWLLGDVDRSQAAELARRVGSALGVHVTIQPGKLDPRLSDRPNWNGRSGTVVLNQLLRRDQPGCLTNVAIVADNLVSSSCDNWLFGYAYVGWAAACMSFEPLQSDNPDFDRLIVRAKSICLHEIGHTLGLDDHTYDSGIDCCMLGEVSHDSLFLTDSYSSDFCRECLSSAKQALRAFGESIEANRFVPDEGLLFSGRYELQGFVAQGGMGTVWQAKDLNLEETVALKFVSTIAFNGPGEVQLRNEAAKARRLSHPNIVRVFDFVREAGVGCLVMDWIEGTDLESLRKSQALKVFEPSQIRSWIVQLGLALKEAHSRGVVHQDIKPVNCMIDQQGSLKVLDFGISRSDSQRVEGKIHSVSSGGWGTLGYSAPEQMIPGPSSTRHDIYAFGATVYALLAGVPPRIEITPHGEIRWTGELKPMGMLRRAISSNLSAIPRTWENAIARCVDLDSSRRPSTVAEVLAEMGLADGAVGEVAASSKPSLWRRLFSSS